jgi:hypothetical protein
MFDFFQANWSKLKTVDKQFCSSTVRVKTSVVFFACFVCSGRVLFLFFETQADEEKA